MLLLTLTLGLALAPSGARAAPTLIDHRIASGLPPLSLDGEWSVTNTHGPQASQPPLPATVPGDIVSDLQRAGRVPDPYYNTTWRDPDFIAAWNNGTWTYRRTFATPHLASDHSGSPSQSYLLVLDGIRMGAIVTLNGAPLGNATDQFLRYVFPLVSLSASGQNVLEITFGASLGIDCGGRWTYSAEIDWAPAMLTYDNSSKRSTFGFGAGNAFLSCSQNRNDQFTKTGSGQTQEKWRENGDFCRDLEERLSPACAQGWRCNLRARAADILPGRPSDGAAERW
jgi:hypothetical protein